MSVCMSISFAIIFKASYSRTKSESRCSHVVIATLLTNFYPLLLAYLAFRGQEFVRSWSSVPGLKALFFKTFYIKICPVFLRSKKPLYIYIKQLEKNDLKYFRLFGACATTHNERYAVSCMAYFLSVVMAFQDDNFLL